MKAGTVATAQFDKKEFFIPEKNWHVFAFIQSRNVEQTFFRKHRHISNPLESLTSGSM
jgi:hypothetical protein